MNITQMPIEEKDPRYKLIRLNLLVKVAEGELDHLKEGSHEYYIQLLRMIYSGLVSSVHNEQFIQKKDKEELKLQAVPDLRGQQIDDGFEPPNDLGPAELKFLLFPGSILYASREWNSNVVASVTKELKDELNRQVSADSASGDIVEFPGKR